jgi:hypothetical protein
VGSDGHEPRSDAPHPELLNAVAAEHCHMRLAAGDAFPARHVSQAEPHEGSVVTQRVAATFSVS